jgi:hypothetical protein
MSEPVTDSTPVTGLVGTYRARGASHMAGLRPASRPELEVR